VVEIEEFGKSSQERLTRSTVISTYASELVVPPGLPRHGSPPVLSFVHLYVRLIDFCITQLKAQGPSRTCNESKEEEEDLREVLGSDRVAHQPGHFFSEAMREHLVLPQPQRQVHPLWRGDGRPLVPPSKRVEAPSTRLKGGGLPLPPTLSRLATAHPLPILPASSSLMVLLPGALLWALGGRVAARCAVARTRRVICGMWTGREFIDYKTSMILDEDPLWGLLFY